VQQLIGKYYIYAEGLKSGEDALKTNDAELIVIDEIGKLELEEKGWHNSLLQIVSHSKSHLLLSVREEVLNEILDKYRISPNAIFNVSKEKGDNLFLKIQSDLQCSN
jgi:nucleoside-triphosphatase THEP1